MSVQSPYATLVFIALVFIAGIACVVASVAFDLWLEWQARGGPL